MATFNARSFESLDSALDSGDTDVIVKAALKVWKDANSKERTFLLAKATRRAVATDRYTVRSFADEIGKSHPTVVNYSTTFTLAETAGVPDVDLVAHLYTIIGNVHGKQRADWIASLPEDPAERRKAIMATDYKSLKAPKTERGPKVPEPKDETPEPEVTPEPKPSTAENYLVVLQALVGKVKAGEFTAEESAKFHRLATELRHAAEYATAATAKGAKVAA